ncbi:FkbH: FkbH domain protein [Actinomadura rubteroloni]|uniref:FkbH: FkbH domain protein n=2 Tax=Actinomadura rubteroloni TaxID=1926885 RepID=A0A2P4UIQ2_9ACTN|nr:FkbH: FkbH domain protein [Actinomadura rubteroloni]
MIGDEWDRHTERTGMSVTELHRAGRLAAEYPAVRGLLAGADPDTLRRAGQVLARLDPVAVLAEHPDVPVLSVAVTGHGTLGPLVPAVAAELARHGLLGRFTTGDFDGYVFELSDPESPIYAADPDVVLCLLDPEIVFDELPSPWTAADVEDALRAKVRLIESLAQRFTETTRATLVLNTPPLPSRFTAQLVDYRSRARLGIAWRTACSELLRLAQTHDRVVTIDVDPLLAEGIAADDARLGVYTGLHLSPDLLARYAREVGHLARNLTGRTKKALVVDLDGTLWGGVLGDDGIEGIEVAGGYRGKAFQAFQHAVKQIAGQGVLLAAVSKNDAETVREVLRDHPEMALREDDFVRVVANWRPKHDNLAELAKDLNLSTDAFVFVDDSSFECGLVRHALPGVAVVALDTEPALHLGRLLADGWFDVRELTAEDRQRSGRYREDLARKDFLDTFDSLQDYLDELDVQVRLEPADDAGVPRLSQITLRTNQFNLTTERLQPADVRARLDDPDARVLSVRSEDRFGSNGVVGAIFLRWDGPVLSVENFLLSCRVFSRGIEQACLSAVLRYASAAGAERVRGTYRPSPKNTRVRDFYQRNGFTAAGEEDGASVFVHDLADIADTPSHLRLDDLLAGTGR